MKYRSFLFSFVAVTVSLSALTAGEQTPQSRSNDSTNADPLGREVERLCRIMLAKQTVVYKRTQTLHTAIRETADKKPSPRDKKAALKLATEMKEIIKVASRLIDMLEADGVARAFPELFHELRKDMIKIRCRLLICDVGLATQIIEKDIIDTLNEMIWALKK